MRLLPALALLAALAGCSAESITRPDPPESWNASAVPAPEPAPFAVVVYQRASLFSVRRATGSVVHSSPEHGTIVLTSMRVVDDPTEPVGVWACTAKGLESLQADVVFPPASNFNVISRAFSGLSGNSFVLLRLRGDRAFETVPIEPSDLKEVARESDVELVAVAPEGWPHRHRFKWAAMIPEEAVREEHLGGPLLIGGRLAGIFGATTRDWNVLFKTAGVGAMRERLREAGLEWALQAK